MSKRYIKELPSGGIEITLFAGIPIPTHGMVEVDEIDLAGKNPDKCRIKDGKVYEDKSITTPQEVRENNKKSAISKLKLAGLTDQEIEAIL